MEEKLRSPQPVIAGLKIVVAIVAAELCVMLALRLLGAGTSISPYVLDLIDTLVLSLAASIIIVYWVVRPMKLSQQLLQKEKTLRESEDRYRSLFENMLEGYAYCKILLEHDKPADFIYVDVNHVFEGLTGLKNVAGKKVSEVIPGITESNPELFEICGRVALTGKPERFETYLESLGIWFSIAVYSPGKEYFVAVFDNITERKRIEEVSARLAAIVESSDDAIIGKDLNGMITSWNSGAERLFGYSANESMGRSIMQIIPQDRVNEEEQLWDHIRHSERVQPFETVRLAKNGHLINVSVTASPIKDASGKIVGTSKVARDITERKIIEEVLRKSEEKYRTIFESVQDVYYETSLQGEILEVSPSIKVLSGGQYQRDDLIGKLMSDFYADPGERQAFLATLQAQGHVTDFEMFLKNRDGSRVPCSISAMIRSNDQGQSEQIIGSLRDITERKRAEEATRKSEQQFRSVWDHSADGMRLTNEAGQIIEVNESYCRLVNMTRDTLVGQFLSVVYERRGPDDNLNLYSERFRSGKVDPHITAPAILWDGRSVELEISSSYIGENGHNRRCLSIFRDITELKKTEKVNGALSLLGHRLSSAESSEQAARIIADVADQLFGWDACVVDYYSAQQDSVIPILNFDTLNGEKVDVVSTQLSEKPTQRTRQILKMGSQLILREEGGGFASDAVPFGDISRPSASLMYVPIHHGAETIGVFSIQSYTHNKYNENDLATLQGLADHCGGAFARIRTQDELKVQTSNFRQLFENSPYGIALLDDKDGIVDTNRSFTNLFQFQLNDIKGRNLDDFIVPNDLLGEAREYIVKRSEGEVVLGETVRKRNDGSLVHVLITANPVDVAHKQAGVFILYLDITELKLAEEQNRILAQAIKSISECVSITDLDNKILFLNDVFLRTYGYEEGELLGKDIGLVRSEENRAGIAGDILASTIQGSWQGELLNRRKDGSKFPISLSTSIVTNEEGKAIALIGVATDITECKQAEETKRGLEAQLQQVQRLDSIGTLASGIAHDFNNILGIILGYSTLLNEFREDPQKYSEGVAAIEKATRRGASLVKQLLLFARKSDALLESLSVNGIITEITSLLQQTFPKTIEISTSLQQDLPAILADASQIHQVLLNLCVNARDAMSNNGTLSISSKSIEGKDVRLRFAEAVARQYVQIEVADTGIGMDEQTRRRIFEPFFTTKDIGKGTGLGLAVVFGIVEQNGGFIDVRSAPGEGTSFIVYLPIPERDVEVLQPAGKDLEEIPAGTETILIIEDEELLKELLKASLVSKGYTILTAGDGVQGVNMYQSHQNEIAVVVSDVGLPLLSGQDVFRKIREINPEAKVILASGFIEPEAKSQMYRAGLKNFIQKPYLQDEVLRKIREAIDRK